MSRWLKGVNQLSGLLEKLDDTVENAADDRATATEDQDDPFDIALNVILAKRGFETGSDDEKREIACPQQMGEVKNCLTNQNERKAESNSACPGSETGHRSNGGSDEGVGSTSEPGICMHDGDQQSKKQIISAKGDAIELSVDVSANDSKGKKSTGEVFFSEKGLPTQKEEESTTASKEAQKEVRVLRRHVVKLNKTLEEAEKEILALRGELGLAADRMEKDRNRAKEEKEGIQKRSVENDAALRKNYDQRSEDTQTRFDAQMASYKDELADLESRRKQEGGDWNQELSQALEREQEMTTRVAHLEDEKAVLLLQISTLQGQQTSLGLRLESLSQATDNAMARERESENRLDATLNQHARQISQRQLREAELERTIQVMNAALVIARNEVRGEIGRDDPSEGSRSSNASFKAHIDALESDVSATNSRLVLEMQKSETLRQQLKETAQESTAVQSKQLQYQRSLEDMTLTISKLENDLSCCKNEKTINNKMSRDPKQDDKDLAEQLKILSEEVLRLRDKLAKSASEFLTLKSRLKSALERAEKAENELVFSPSVDAAAQDSAQRLYDSGISSHTRRRRRPGEISSGSIRSVMRLNSGRGERTEQIGKVVDAVDSFSVKTGKYLRRNPMARAGFIIYLLLVHVWTFVFLFFHARNFESYEIRQDGRAQLAEYVGPHALLRQPKDLMRNELAAVVQNEAERPIAGFD